MGEEKDVYNTFVLQHPRRLSFHMCVYVLSHTFGSSLFAVVVIVVITHQVQLELPAGYWLLCWLSLVQVAVTAVSL